MTDVRPIGDLIETLIDYRGKTPPKTKSGVPLITAKVIKGGRITSDHPEFIADDTYDTWMRRGLPRAGDILITTEAPLGEVAQIGPDARVALAQRVILLRPDTRKVDPQFLFHYLRSPEAQARLRRRASGTTVSGIRQPELRAVEISLLGRRVQETVGQILDALDGLIENNRRRVELLEQMAQTIYGEWFVRFRHPGQEDLVLVNSALGMIPEGWEIRQLREVSSIVRGRSYRKHELVESGGVPFVNLKCMLRGGGFRRDGLKRYVGVYNPDQRVSGGDIVLAVTDLTQGREILARATLVPRLAEGFGVISLDVARIVPEDSEDRLALFFALRCTDFADRVKEYANGSTVLHLSPTHVAEGQIVWPPQSLRRPFVRVVEAMVDQVHDLNDARERLGRIRDLLLPKLVSGQIDVSKVDLDALVESVA